MLIYTKYNNQGHIQGGAVRGTPPLDFQNLKRKRTVTHHSNRKGDKKEDGWKKEKYRKTLFSY